MFNKTYINRGSTHSHITANVTETRAPTDESVRLLSEMERAAEEKLVARYTAKIEDNGLNATILVFDYNRLDLTNVCYIAFTLNGHKYEKRLVCAEDEISSFNELYDAVSKEITDMLIKQNFSKIRSVLRVAE